MVVRLVETVEARGVTGEKVAVEEDLGGSAEEKVAMAGP